MDSLPSTARTAKHRQRSRRPQAFTLIELLVVIAIIAILAGLLFPAGQSAINAAKKTTAKNQVVQIATAITAYETEYGRLPPGTFTTVNPTLVSILCTANDANNPRGLIFLEANAWKNGKGGTNSSGFCDPFASLLFRIEDRPHEALTSDSTVHQRPGDRDYPATPPLLPNRPMAKFLGLVLPNAGVVQW
ncbi:MAG: type II secretion system protein [Verrucomicrobia bacterium]|nr:type II secretion system protein [Verrucomicrobiota bacterium]